MDNYFDSMLKLSFTLINTFTHVAEFTKSSSYNQPPISHAKNRPVSMKKM